MRARAVALWLGLALFASSALAGAALAQSGSAQSAGAQPQPIGKVESASGIVTVTHAEGVVLQANVDPSGGLKAKVGDPVYRGDLVQTGPDSAAGMVFTDGTAFNLSANARIELNEFVYDPNGKSNSAFISLAKGTFTFIAGKVAKTGDMKIDTPVATMGIRGTTPHVEIRDDGTVAFSTLLEDKKAIEKGITATAPPKKQRQAKSGEPVSAQPVPGIPALGSNTSA